jgi:hypothetical protein
MISTQLEALNTITGYDMDQFYVVTLWNNRLEFQGDLNRKTLEIAKNLGIQLVWNESTFALTGQDGNIRICLTADKL